MKIRWPWTPKPNQVITNFPPYDKDQLSQTIFGPKENLSDLLAQINSSSPGASSVTLPLSKKDQPTTQVSPWPPVEDVAAQNPFK